MESQEKKILFNFTQIATEQFAIIQDNFKSEGLTYFTVNLKFAANKDLKSLAVNVETRFEQDKIPFIVLSINCHFEIHPDNWDYFEITPENKMKVDVNFIRQLSTISVGACRGVLHAKTEQTEFNKFIIPLINLNEIITDDVKFQM